MFTHIQYVHEQTHSPGGGTFPQHRGRGFVIADIHIISILFIFFYFFFYFNNEVRVPHILLLKQVSMLIAVSHIRKITCL